MGPYGASCVKTLSDDQREIPKEIWDQLEIGPDHRFGMVCTDPANFADWKKAILKLCYLTKACTYNVKTKVVQFADKMESFTISMEKNYVLKEAESTTEDGEEEEGTYARVGDSEVPHCNRAGEETPTCDY